MQKQVWTVNSLISWTINFFKHKNINNPRLSAELLLSYVLGLSRMELYLNYDLVPKKDQLEKYRMLIFKRLEHVPIQYLTNEAGFRKLNLFVNQSVLIPRPETELLVDEAMEKLKSFFIDKKNLRILEIGTGSGAIALSLATEIKNTFPGRLFEIIATEKSCQAVETADKNARMILKEEYPEILKIINCDILPENDAGFDEKYLNGFDIVISNPPYIKEADFKDLPEEIRKHEPSSALIGGREGTEVYQAILEKIKKYLNKEKFLIIFETDPLVFKSLVNICVSSLGNAEVTVKKDYNDLERIVSITFPGQSTHFI